MDIFHTNLFLPANKLHFAIRHSSIDTIWQHSFDCAQRASIFPSGQTLRFMQVSALLKDVFASHKSLDAQSVHAWNFEIDARKGNVMSATISLGEKMYAQ